MSGKCWKVVGGADKGGILAKAGKDLTTDKLDKLLANGAIVQELELSGIRLRYKLIKGDGPPTGWVSLKIQNKDLLVPDDFVVKPEKEEEIPEGAPELVYFDGCGRGELSRLALHAGGVIFRDTRVTQEEWDKMRVDPKSKPGSMFGKMPVLFHGSSQISQSAACAQYAAEIGMYKDKARTPEQRATDSMILGVRADLHQEMFIPYFVPEKAQEAFKKQLPGKIGYLLAGLEQLYTKTPGPFLYTSEEEGPTLSDLVIFDLVTSPLPGMRFLQIDLSKYNSLTVCADAVRKTLAYPGLTAYLDKRPTMDAELAELEAAAKK